jgi:hypothetical protein
MPGNQAMPHIYAVFMPMKSCQNHLVPLNCGRAAMLFLTAKSLIVLPADHRRSDRWNRMFKS